MPTWKLSETTSCWPKSATRLLIMVGGVCFCLGFTLNVILSLVLGSSGSGIAASVGDNTKYAKVASLPPGTGWGAGNDTLHQQQYHQRDDVEAVVKIFRNTSGVTFLKFHKVSGDTLKRLLQSKFGANDVPDAENSPCHYYDVYEQGAGGHRHFFDPHDHFTLFRYAFEGRRGLERCFVEPERMVVVSMLRDPLERALSWIFSSVGALDYTKWSGNDTTATLTVEKLLNNVSNQAFEGNLHEYVSALAYPHLIPLNVEIQKVRLRTPPSSHVPNLSSRISNNEIAIQTAVKAIQHQVDIVMIKEYQCESYIVLAHQLEWNFTTVCPQEIVHWWLKHESEREKVTPKVREALKEIIQGEYDVYNAALERFRSTLNAVVVSRGGNLTQLKEQFNLECPKFDCNISSISR